MKGKRLVKTCQDLLGKWWEIQGLLLAIHVLQMSYLFHNANKAVFATELILVN